MKAVESVRNRTSVFVTGPQTWGEKVNCWKGRQMESLLRLIACFVMYVVSSKRHQLFALADLCKSVYSYMDI
jgi:hypothetical protein